MSLGYFYGKIDGKMQRLFESMQQSAIQQTTYMPEETVVLKRTRSRNYILNNTVMDETVLAKQLSSPVKSLNVSWNTFRAELKDIVRSEVSNVNMKVNKRLTEATSIPEEPHHVPEEETILHNTFDFKIPELPDAIISTEQKNNVRRSIRIRRMTLIECSPDAGNTSRQQSSRISIRRDSVTIAAPISRRRPTLVQSVSEPLMVLSKARTKKQALTLHKEFILKLFNTGNIKELQILPQIGLKTAYQIITHRSLNGKFKKIDDVGKMPIWRGKSWERFQKANNLI